MVGYTLGNSGPAERDKLLGEALALLHPISFDEPFGLSVAESMISGTPVVAFKRGSMPELIQHKKTGFLVDTVEEAVESINRIETIDRNYCNVWAVSNFSLEKMVDGYYNVYKQILNNK